MSPPNPNKSINAHLLKGRALTLEKWIDLILITDWAFREAKIQAGAWFPGDENHPSVIDEGRDMFEYHRRLAVNRLVAMAAKTHPEILKMSLDGCDLSFDLEDWEFRCQD